MGIIRWKPWQEIDTFLEQMSSLNGQSFDLATDVYENKDAVIVKVHVPGIEAENIYLKVEQSHLHITGKRENKEEVEGEHYYHREIRCGSFERVIPLPCKVAQKNVQAELHDGILTITLPKEDKREAHHIPVTKK